MIRLNAVSVRCLAFYLFLTMFLLPICLYAECRIDLTWDPNIPAPDGYRVYQRESGKSFNENIYTDTGPSTIYTISGLTDNTTYHFVVRAYVGSEESANSNEATYDCNGGSTGGATNSSSNPPRQPLAVAPPNQTVDVSLRPTLTTSAFIDHDPGDYHAQSRWTIYRLDDDACVFDVTSSSDLTSVTVPSSTLLPFTSYYWSVCYLDQNGDMSAPSQAFDFTTLQASAGEPDNTQNDSSASLSSNRNSSGSGSGSSGLGCFIQTLFGVR